MTRDGRVGRRRGRVPPRAAARAGDGGPLGTECAGVAIVCVVVPNEANCEYESIPFVNRPKRERFGHATVDVICQRKLCFPRHMLPPATCVFP